MAANSFSAVFMVLLSIGQVKLSAALGFTLSEPIFRKLGLP